MASNNSFYTSLTARRSEKCSQSFPVRLSSSPPTSSASARCAPSRSPHLALRAALHTGEEVVKVDQLYCEGEITADEHDECKRRIENVRNGPANDAFWQSALRRIVSEVVRLAYSLLLLSALSHGTNLTQCPDAPEQKQEFRGHTTQSQEMLPPARTDEMPRRSTDLGRSTRGQDRTAVSDAL